MKTTADTSDGFTRYLLAFKNLATAGKLSMFLLHQEFLKEYAV